ncbi:hypothetical protein P171DRAFT_16287 [Karstenula rhodostoma CBS 690.94]|uniref:Uncharacterized protein n=1 Tax=Karstenula rhodostoma CBS 690.94 TaxID=1392251 RepID=A0A9P4UK51_9PLEO|nr:hypothetical protein P171DRAFT_16287 [Karstenula rhodostoma CBS 690.94]
MSRDNTPFSEAGQDGYLPVYGQRDEQFGGRNDFLDDEDTPTFSSTFDRDVLDDLGLGLHDGGIAPANSRAESGTATPVDGHSPEIDFRGYSFGQNLRDPHAYPVPGELDRGTDPYPPYLHTPHALHHKTDERPLLYISGTNNNTDYAPSMVQNFNRAHPPHRRSWSQNDIERLPNLAPQPYPPGVRHPPPHSHQHAQTTENPTFVRICETRHSRPPARISSDGKHPGRYTHSQTRAGHNGRTNPPTSMPVGIGVPLTSANQPVPTSGNVQLTGPKLVHMSQAEQRKTSQKIIEVGAMAVLNMVFAHGKVENIDPRLFLMGYEGRTREKSSAPSPEPVGERDEPRKKMLEDLMKMERLLKEGGDGEEEKKALRGCEIIREVLGKMGGRGNERHGVNVCLGE